MLAKPSRSKFASIAERVEFITPAAEGELAITAFDDLFVNEYCAFNRLPNNFGRRFFISVIYLKNEFPLNPIAPTTCI